MIFIYLFICHTLGVCQWKKHGRYSHPSGKRQAMDKRVNWCHVKKAKPVKEHREGWRGIDRVTGSKEMPPGRTDISAVLAEGNWKRKPSRVRVEGGSFWTELVMQAAGLGGQAPCSLGEPGTLWRDSREVRSCEGSSWGRVWSNRSKMWAIFVMSHSYIF